MAIILTRRSMLAGLAGLAAAPLAACSSDPDPAGPVPAPSPASPPAGTDPRFPALEERFGARLGIFALDTRSGRTVVHRADERFAFCSTIKVFAAGALLQRNSIAELGRVARYTEADLVDYSPVTEKHVDSGMTLADIVAAALQYSDNTAGNLLFRELGGPVQVEAALRALGDTVTNVDRTEPTLNEAKPGDPRDTTTPRALATSFRAYLLGAALPAGKQRFLTFLLDGNTTGGSLIRAAVPQEWRVGDKTGSGRYGTRNDVALLRPPTGGPYVVAVMSSKAAEDARSDDALVAEAARVAVPLLA